MPTTDPETSPNAFEPDKPGTNARTDAEAAIEALRERGGVFVNAVRATRMPMAMTDPNLPGNPIVFANESFLKLSGYSMEEVLGQQPHFMNGAGTDPKDVARFSEVLRSNQDDIIETVQYRKDGSRFVATVLLSAYKDAEGNTLNHFMSWLDVTRRVEAEDEIAELKAAQAQLRKTEAALRESKELQTFLLTLGDALREESSAERKIEVAAHMLGKRLNASRVLWAEYDWERNLALIFNGWFADGAQPFPTVMQLADYEGEALNQLKSGQTVRVDNVGLLTDEPAYAAIAKVGVQALLTPPLLVNRKLKANLSIHQHEPRHWTDDEVTLVEEVSERLWAEVVRARAEDALRASEERYRTLFESIDEGFALIEVIFDHEGEPVDLLHLDTNPAYERHTGLRDVVGKRALEIAPDFDPMWFDFYGKIARTGEAARTESYIDAVDRWITLYASRIGGEGSRKIAVVFNDITERKRTEIALRNSEARLAATFESVPAGIATIGLDGKAILANAEFRRFIPSGIVPSRDAEHRSRWKAWDREGRLLDPKDYPTAKALRGEAVTPGQEMLYTDDNGRQIWTNVATVPTLGDHGRVTGTITVISDIDERKRAEVALRDREEKLRLIVEGARDYAIFTLDLDGRIRSWLPGAENVFGWSKEEAEGQPVDMTFTAEDRAAAEPRKELETALRDGTAPNVRWHVCKDGRRVFIDGYVVALRDEAGNVDSFLKIGQDTTDKHRASEFQATLLAELQHRVRNLLAMIRSIGQRTTETTSTVEEYWQHLEGRITAMARTQSLLTRRVGAGVDLQNLVLDELEAQAAPASQFAVAGPDVTLGAKPAEVLGLAIHELATNSVKYGALSNHGQIDIRWTVSNDDGGGLLQLVWRETGIDTENTPKRHGFGTELITERVPYELRGTGTLEFAKHELSATIELPLPEGSSDLRIDEVLQGSSR